MAPERLQPERGQASNVDDEAVAIDPGHGRQLTTEVELLDMRPFVEGQPLCKGQRGSFKNFARILHSC